MTPCSTPTTGLEAAGWVLEHERSEDGHGQTLLRCVPSDFLLPASVYGGQLPRPGGVA